MLFNELVESCISYSEFKTDLKQLKKAGKNEERPIDLEEGSQVTDPKEAKKVKKYKKKKAKLSLNILLRLFASFSFKFNMLVSRRLSRQIKKLIESYMA